MIDPVAVMAKLDADANELDARSLALAQVEHELEPIEVQVEEFRAQFEEGLWAQHLNGAKFPPEKLRERLANRAMDPALLGAYSGLMMRRKRLEKRISSLKATISANQSIISALSKAGQIDGSGLRRAA